MPSPAVPVSPVRISRGDRDPPVYYSQHGEDRWIVENLKIPQAGTFVEVGCQRWPLSEQQQGV